ncbi:MAG: NADH-quinone oxidoreductase subunit J [Pirellulales bacterium]
MVPLVLAQTSPALFSEANLWLWIGVALGGVGLFLVQMALGSTQNKNAMTGIGVLSIIAALAMYSFQQPVSIDSYLQLAFGWIAVFGAVAFVCCRQPVHAALGFAVSVLASSGIYMLQSAPFMAAANAIVYAGATIIIFLFVLMFAQQSHLQAYDLRFSSPKLSILAGIALLGVLLWALQTMPESPAVGSSSTTVADLGRSLFGEFLWTVEIAGTLLLIATIGAIVIAQRDASTGESTRPESNSPRS